MRFDSNVHRRHSIRLKGYDYTDPGVYFVTISAADRAPLFDGTTADVIRSVWLSIPHHFPNAELDEFIVMPDHFHAILHILPYDPPVGAKHSPSDRTYNLAVNGANASPLAE